MIKHVLLAAFAATTTALERCCVVGGSGFIGKAVCKTLAAKGVAVTSVSRSGRPADAEPWMDKVDWVAADAAKDSLSAALDGTGACISCVGGFTDAKAYDRLGMKCWGFSPVRLPPEAKFAQMFHGHNERIPVDGFHFGVRALFDLVSGLVL